MEGRCTCGAVRYRLSIPPLFTHCCHCRWCQRQTGSPCVVNAMIETDRLQLLAGQPEMIAIPSPSGMGQTVARCPDCKIALWSAYGLAGDDIRFVRACTLDDSDALRLNSIFTPVPNSHGWSSDPASLPFPNSTVPPTTGPQRA